MNLTESITFQVTTADSFGDDTVSTEYVTAAGVEQCERGHCHLSADCRRSRNSPGVFVT
jgi:hypothetical protein